MESSTQDFGSIMCNLHNDLHNRKHPVSQRLAVLQVLCAVIAIIAQLVCSVADTFLWHIGHGFWGGILMCVAGCVWIRFCTEENIPTHRVALVSIFMFLSVEVALCTVSLAVLDVMYMIYTTQSELNMLGVFGASLLVLAGLINSAVGLAALVRLSRGPFVDLIEQRIKGKEIMYTQLRADNKLKQAGISTSGLINA